MAYQIAICDDEPLFCSKMHEFLITYQNELQNELYVTEYQKGCDLLSDMKNGTFFHILILDIKIKNEDGIELAEKIREFNNQAVIIFATGHDNFALQAYNVDAAGYLVKPFPYIKLKAVLNKSIIMVDFLTDIINTKEKYLEIKVRNDTIYIPCDSIVYMEKIVNQIKIHTTDKLYSTYESFKSLRTRIDNYKFPQVHQGYIVNFKRITNIGPSSVYLDDTMEIPVSRRYYSSLLKRYKAESIDTLLKKRSLVFHHSLSKVFP